MSGYKKIGSLDNLGQLASELIDAYIESSDLLSHRQLAVMEQRIWDALSPTKRKEWRRAYFFREVFGGGVRCFQVRSMLHSLGKKIDPVWERLEHDYPERISLSTAVNIAREAKKRHVAYPKEFPKFSDALASALAEYDALPLSTVMEDGTVVRKKAPLGTPPRRKATQKAKISKRSNSEKTPKRFYGEMRTLVSAYIAEYLEDADEETAEQIYADFEIELKVIIRMLQQRLASAKRQFNNERQLSDRTRQGHLRDDFIELGMDPPKPILKPDLKKIRSQYKALARAYHPDKQPPGAPDLSAKFQAATEAYNRIIAYYRDKGIT